MPCSNSHFQSALLSRLTQTAEILRPTDNRDRFGAVSADKFRVVHRYRCRLLRDGSPQAPEVAGDKSVVRSEWRILLPADADVCSDDKIRVGDQMYEVLDTDQGRADATFLTAFCRRAA